MISLTKLSGSNFIVNAELIKFIEETPDTIITLRGGEKFLVKQSADTVVERAIAYARTIRTFGGIDT